MNVELLKALADKTRLGMLRHIAKAEVCACELPAIVKTSQPAVSQHLAVLREEGLVKMRKDGAKRLYSISGKGRKILKDVDGW